MKKDGVILILENSTDYLFMLDQAFRKMQIVNPLRVARYGNEAILYLKGVGIYGDRTRYPMPHLIIVDLAIPDGSGFAVLGWIRRQPELLNVPVIVLVHPTQPNSGQEVFDSRANSFQVRRDDLANLGRMIKSIEPAREKAPTRG